MGYSPSEAIGCTEARGAPRTPAGEMSKGNVPHLLKAAMNIRIAFEGVVPTCWVAAAKAAFSSGKTFATTGVMCSAMVSPNRYDTSTFARASGWAKSARRV